MDNIFIILIAAFIITMVIWFLYSVFFALSENEKRKRKKKVKYKDKEVVKKETQIKEYVIKDMRQEKNTNKVGIVEETIDENEEEPKEYGNYMYDVLVERNVENKVYHTEPTLEEKSEFEIVKNNEKILLENDLSDNQPKKYYGKVKDVDYVKIVNSLKEMENKQNDKNETLASEFKNLSKEMKIYIIDNIIGNL